MAPGSRARGAADRSAARRAGAGRDPAVHVRPVRGARDADVGERGGPRVRDGPQRAPARAVPAEQRLAPARDRRDVRVRAHRDARDGDGGVVRELLKHQDIRSITLCEIDEVQLYLFPAYYSF